MTLWLLWTRFDVIKSCRTIAFQTNREKVAKIRTFILWMNHGIRFTNFYRNIVFYGYFGMLFTFVFTWIYKHEREVKLLFLRITNIVDTVLKSSWTNLCVIELSWIRHRTTDNVVQHVYRFEKTSTFANLCDRRFSRTDGFCTEIWSRRSFNRT